MKKGRRSSGRRRVAVALVHQYWTTSDKPADLRSHSFRHLSDEQIEAFDRHGEEVVFGVGDVLFEEGQRPNACGCSSKGRVQCSGASSTKRQCFSDGAAARAGGFRRVAHRLQLLATARGADPPHVQAPRAELKVLAMRGFPRVH